MTLDKIKIKASDSYPLLPLRDTVVFPGSMIPLFVGRIKSIAAVDKALASNKFIVLSAQKDSKLNDPTPKDIHKVGSLTKITQIMRHPDGSVKVLVEGLKRVNIVKYLESAEIFRVKLSEFKSVIKADFELDALLRSAKFQLAELGKITESIAEEFLLTINEESDPERVTDMISGYFINPSPQKQIMLAEPNLKKRLESLVGFMQNEIEVASLEKTVRGRIKSQMEKTQRDYYLHEQMKAIQKELGSKGGQDEKSESEELCDKIRKAKMPAEVEKRSLKELDRLDKMPPMSAEGTVSRNYIEWLIDVPWSKRTKDKLDIKEAGKILEEDHYGLEKVKERIVEYLAVKALVKKMRGPILCFLGPPGVGKTSLGKSIARAMGRRFIRFSLGGIRDEAEIRGHRRTYIGALPGRLIQAMKRAKTINPLIMLDEIDKVGIDFRGDPSSALLEALDPEQNHAFNDHYLEVDYDLSEVTFITTANTLATIPRPLRDRMEVIELSGYSDGEKLDIAKKFLIRNQIKMHGLEKFSIKFSDQSILKIIKHFTKESGVRELERQLGGVCRKIAKEFALKKDKSKNKKKLKANSNVVVNITDKKVSEYLGENKFESEDIELEDTVGTVVGLAWSEVGGSILKIEVSPVEGKGKFILTGKLGEVMQESAQASLTYIRSKRKEFGLTKGFHEKIDLHLHIPEGATPKEGPSAGVALTVAMFSALTNKPVRRDIAMTGEITLSGKALPIGGLKEKILAAVRAKITTVLIPSKNKRDLAELPEELRNSLHIIMIDSIDEALEYAIVGLRIKKSTKRGKEIISHAVCDLN
ncbi:MAG: endopeptidase La [Nitrospinota bacterium]